MKFLVILILVSSSFIIFGSITIRAPPGRAVGTHQPGTRTAQTGTFNPTGTGTPNPNGPFTQITPTLSGTQQPTSEAQSIALGNLSSPPVPPQSSSTNSQKPTRSSSSSPRPSRRPHSGGSRISAKQALGVGVGIGIGKYQFISINSRYINCATTYLQREFFFFLFSLAGAIFGATAA